MADMMHLRGLNQTRTLTARNHVRPRPEILSREGDVDVVLADSSIPFALIMVAEESGQVEHVIEHQSDHQERVSAQQQEKFFTLAVIGIGARLEVSTLPFGTWFSRRSFRLASMLTGTKCSAMAANSVTKVRKFTSSRSTTKKHAPPFTEGLINHGRVALAGREAETDHLK